MKITAGNFIGGKFQSNVSSGEKSGEWTSVSPADRQDVLGRVEYSYGDIDRSIESARSAFKVWAKAPFNKRVECLKRYQQILRDREGDLSQIIAREVGKPLWEAKGEVATMINKVDVTINESMRLVEGLSIPDVLPGARGTSIYKPLGVLAVIGPFNFPAHLPNGHIVPALLTGNTVVFKPSEKTPMVGQVMAEIFSAADFPPGVVNMIQGEREVSRRLCIHEGIDGVLFTGSYEVGTRIKQDTLQQHWKLLALEMGGKNATIIWKDADLEVALLETLVSSFVTSGQRCSCTSRILLHDSIADEFIKRFHEQAKRFTIGHPLKNPFMGPLIDTSSVDRFLKFQGIASREGCEMVMTGKKLELSPSGNYVTPSIAVIGDNSLEVAQKSVFQQNEIFAPMVGISRVNEMEHAIELANCTSYGLVCSVFTQSRDTFQKFWDDLEFGCINWNKSTIGASSRLPFGGIKKSGNHFPTGLTAPFYCTYPVASLEVEKPQVNPASFPGLNWS